MSTPASGLSSRRGFKPPSLAIPSSQDAASDVVDPLFRYAKVALENVAFKQKLETVLRGDFSLSKEKAIIIAMAKYYFDQDPAVTFENKKDGVTKGIIVNTRGRRLFCKTFLDVASGQSAIAEVFAYKILQESGFGAEIEMVTSRDSNITFMSSVDLASDGDLKIGEEAIRYIRENQENPELMAQVIMLEMMAKIFTLSDINANADNLAVVISPDGLVRIKILDFHLSPNATEAMTRRASELRFDRMSDDLLAGGDQASVGFLRGCEKLKEEDYEEALRRMSREWLSDIISRATEYCGNFRDRFLVANLEAYQGEFGNNLATFLAMKEQHDTFLSPKGDKDKTKLPRRSSSSMVLGFLDSDGISLSGRSSVLSPQSPGSLMLGAQSQSAGRDNSA